MRPSVRRAVLLGSTLLLALGLSSASVGHGAQDDAEPAPADGDVEVESDADEAAGGEPATGGPVSAVREESVSNGPLALGEVPRAARLPVVQGVPGSERDAATDTVELFAWLTGGGRPFVLVFWSVDCPVCRRYVKKLREIEADHADRARFVLLVPNSDEETEVVREQLEKNRLTWPAFRDPGRSLVEHLGVLVTPTVALFDAQGRLRYRGAIDDDRLAKSREVQDTLLAALGSVLDDAKVERGELRAFGSAVR